MAISRGQASVVLVTGGSGMVGRAVTADLQQHGYQVKNVDVQPAPQTHTVRTDLTDLGQVYGVVAGVDAIVHLAAIPAPGGHPPDVVFETNVLSTFNVLQAGAALGVKRIVIASSLSALGLAYKTLPVELSYFPIDEAHPLLAQDVYGISKQIGETLAEGIVRRVPYLSVTSFRFPFLTGPGKASNALAHWRSSPEAGASILWSYLDVTDAALVIRQALQAALPGHEPFYVAAPDTFMDEETITLLVKHFPGVPCDAEKVQGFASPIDCSAVREKLNFASTVNWRDLMVENP